MREEDAYYPYFDYVRAVAAIGVFAAHADGLTYLPEHLGNACVQIFFALSGFLIGGILLRLKPEDLPKFYFNRATRIWIPYAIAIGLIAFVTAIKQGFQDPKFVEFFFYYITLSTIGLARRNLRIPFTICHSTERLITSGPSASKNNFTY